MNWIEKQYEKYKNTFKGFLVLLLIAGVLNKTLGTILDKVSTLPLTDSLKKIIEFLKTEISVTFPVYILLASFFISVFVYIFLKKVYILYKSRNNKFKILRATYYTSKNSVAITEELNKKIVGDKLKVNLTNDIAGDPDKGISKEGKVIYLYNDKKLERNYKEWDMINLP